ncbi:MAG TPA: transglutaminase domain-containing protein [Flavitalea sp.]|nr:transglutaminase domain-containing protein [Flavitalea sp.]
MIYFKIKKSIIVFIATSLNFALLLFLLGCTTHKTFHLVSVDNPEFRANISFNGYEDLTSPKFTLLKQKYQLDTIFHGENDEMKRIMLLRSWIAKKIKIDNDGPYPGDGSVESILDEALKSHGFHCGHFTEVQNAIMNAYGFVTRCLLIDVGVPVDYIPGGGHHAINEIWSNKYHKWFVSDAKYNCQFEKNGKPLSALEIRDEYFKNKGEDLTYTIETESYPELTNVTKAQFTSVYTWLSWGKYNNRYTNQYKPNTDLMNVLEDEYFKTHTWLWDGKPHWAYKSGLMNRLNDRKLIEWTPNTISSKIMINGNHAKIELSSQTPNIRTYQMKINPETSWEDIPNIIDVSLKNDDNEICFRVINIAGVTGPEHKVRIKQ